MGMLKRRVQPEDVIINCSKGSKVPVAPKGHKWKEVKVLALIYCIATFIYALYTCEWQSESFVAEFEPV